MMFNKVGEVVAIILEAEDEEGVGIFSISLLSNVITVMNLGTFNGNVLKRNKFQEDFT